MPSNKKKRIRERMEKYNESYQTAQQHLYGAAVTTEPPPSEPPLPTTVEILKAYDVGHISTIEVQRLTSARSADPAVASARVSQLLKDPRWSARSKNASHMLTRREYEHMKALGATERGHVQKVVVRHPDDAGTTFSIRCARCHLWLHAGRNEVAAECACGQKIEVRFERSEVWSDTHRMADRFHRCVSCGGRLGLRAPGDPLGRWHLVTALQTACDTCWTDRWESNMPRLREARHL